MLIFCDIVLKFEREFQCCESIGFLSSPATATIICICEKLKIISFRKKLPLSLCLSFYYIIICRVILTHGKQTPKGLHLLTEKCQPDKTRIVPVVKRVQKYEPFYFGYVIFKLVSTTKGAILQGLSDSNGKSKELQTIIWGYYGMKAIKQQQKNLHCYFDIYQSKHFHLCV